MFRKICFILVALSFSLFAQSEENLIQLGEIESSGYGAATMKFSSIKGEFALLMGGYGGWLINHKFMIGGGGSGLVNKIEAPEDAGLDASKQYYLQVGYGGFMMEYIDSPMKLLHYNVKTLIGAGGAGYSLRDDYDIQDSKESAFFVLEIDANIELNVVEYFRIGVGAGYRFVSGVDLEGINDNDLRAFCSNLIFKFGAF